MAANISYNCLTRISFAAGNFMQMFVFFLSGFTFAKTFLSRPLFLVTGKLCFITGLITPVMVQLIYSTLPDGLFVSFNKVLELGIGNVICVMVAAFLLFLAFEFPFRRLIEYTLLPYVSHDDVYHLAHVRRKIAAQNKDNRSVADTLDQPSKYIDVRPLKQSTLTDTGLRTRQIKPNDTIVTQSYSIRNSKFLGDSSSSTK